MGIACKIIRNRNNTIDVVEAPNGDNSKLFNDLLEYVGNEEKALDLWTLPYTIGFINTNGNWQEGQSTLKLDSNGEPSIKDVLSYSKLIRSEGKRLSNKQLSELANNLYSLPINDFDSLYREIRSTFYKNGYFEITQEAINESILYNELEALDILSNSVLQNQIKDLVETIETEYLSDNSSKFNTLVSTYYFQDEDLIMDKSQIVGIGKYKALNPFEVDKQMASYLSGISNRDAFDNKVKDLPFPSIVSLYQTNEEFADNLFKRFSSLTVIPRFKEIGDNLEQRLDSETSLTMKETVLTDIDNTDFLDNVEFLRNIDSVTWQDSTEEVAQVLREVEENLVDFNIDVIGLSQMADTKSQEDVISLLNTIADFTISLNTELVTEETIEQVADEISNFFDLNTEQIVDYKQVSVNNEGRALLNLTPVSNEIELFRRHSLVKTIDGAYHKVNVIQNTENLYETVYSLVQQDNLLLPKEAFYPTAFNSNDVFNRSKLVNVENKDLIKNDIRRFIRKKMSDYNTEVSLNQMDSLEKLLVYKMLFKHPLNINAEVNMEQEFNNILNFNGNTDYLVNEFISDFYNYQLVNKLADNEVYNDVLRHFKVDERGIVLANDDLHTKQQIRLLSPSNTIMNNLRQYSYLTKDNSFDNLFITEPTTSSEINDNQFKRQFYMNNIEQLSTYKGNYDTDGDLLITNNVNDEFLRTKRGLYEKIAEQGNTSFYRELPTFSNPYFKTYGVKVNVNKNVDLNKYSSYISTQDGSFKKMNNLYNDKELQNINKQIDECG